MQKLYLPTPVTLHLKYQFLYSVSQVNEVHFDLSPNLSPTLERGFDSYSPSLVGNPLGVRLFALYFTQLRTAIVDVPASR